jgi:hypothetical protein
VTTATSQSLDTRLRVFDPAGSKLAENDDYEFANPASQLRFRALGEGWYIVVVDSRVPVKWGCRTYSISAVDVSPPTPQPTKTPRPQATAAPPTAIPHPTAIPAEAMYDAYEPNPDFARSANIGVGQTLNLNFNPYPAGIRQIDYDFFRVFVKTGQRLQVETAELASGLDTNLMLYRDNGETIGYNDDCTPGFLQSCLTWLPDYTGVAYVLIGPVGTIPEVVGPGARAYTLSVIDLTGMEPDEKAASNESGSSSTTTTGSDTSDRALPWRVTPLPPTVAPPPTATALPQIVFREISSTPPTPTAQPLQTIVVELTVYYDENDNRAPDMSEGVSSVSVRVLDSQTNQLLGHVFTDQFGHARLMVAATGTVRLSVPYLGYNEAVKAPGEALTIRLAALQLPGLIP